MRERNRSVVRVLRAPKKGFRNKLLTDSQINPARKKVLDQQLLLAAMGGQVKKVEKLLEDGANVNASNTDGGTALTLAAAHDHKDTVGLLLEKGADITVFNHELLLITGALNGHSEITKILIEKLRQGDKK